MGRVRDRRLSRLEASRERAKTSESGRREALAARAAVAAFIRAGLEARGLDPERAAALCRTAPADPEPDAPAAAEAPGLDPALSRFWGRLGTLAERLREEGRPPDLARASLAELLAWLLARTP